MVSLALLTALLLKHTLIFSWGWVLIEVSGQDKLHESDFLPNTIQPTFLEDKLLTFV